MVPYCWSRVERSYIEHERLEENGAKSWRTSNEAGFCFRAGTQGAVNGAHQMRGPWMVFFSPSQTPVGDCPMCGMWCITSPCFPLAQLQPWPPPALSSPNLLFAITQAAAVSAKGPKLNHIFAYSPIPILPNSSTQGWRTMVLIWWLVESSLHVAPRRSNPLGF